MELRKIHQIEKQFGFAANTILRGEIHSLLKFSDRDKKNSLSRTIFAHPYQAKAVVLQESKEVQVARTVRQLLIQDGVDLLVLEKKGSGNRPIKLPGVDILKIRAEKPGGSFTAYEYLLF